MPIDNTLTGIWRFFRFGMDEEESAYYIVESVEEKSEQEVTDKFYIQGTALPRVKSVSGSKATITVSAPLLVYNKADVGRTAIDEIKDGLKLWYDKFDVSSFSGSYVADPGFLMQKASFKVNAKEGATYSLTFTGDADALKSENEDATDDYSMGLETTGDDLFDADTPYRVAQFYDLVAEVGGVEGWVEELNIDIELKLESFNALGQITQRMIQTITELTINFSGTMIHDQRSPIGSEFPWQAYDWTGTDPQYGGLVYTASEALRVGVRAGGETAELSVLPRLDPDAVIFKSSSLNATPGILRTKFEGTAWMTSTATLTGDGTPPTGTGIDY